MRDVVLTHPKFRGNIRQFVHATKPLLCSLPENFLHVIEFNVGSLLAVVGKPQFVVSNDSMQGSLFSVIFLPLKLSYLATYINFQVLVIINCICLHLTEMDSGTRNLTR